MLRRLTDRIQGCQSGPKKISDIVPPDVPVHHADRCVRVLEAVLRCRPTDLKKNGFCLSGPRRGFSTPSRDEFISPISKSSSNSALPVLTIDAFLQCVALFQLFYASRVGWGCGDVALGWFWGWVLWSDWFNAFRTLAQGSLISGRRLGWCAAGTESQTEHYTKQFSCQRHVPILPLRIVGSGKPPARISFLPLPSRSPQNDFLGQCARSSGY